MSLSVFWNGVNRVSPVVRDIQRADTFFFTPMEVGGYQVVAEVSNRQGKVFTGKGWFAAERAEEKDRVPRKVGTPPMIVGVGPKEGSEGIPVDTVFDLYWSERVVNVSTETIQLFRMEGDAKEAVAVDLE